MGPEQISRLSEAYEQTLKALSLKDRNDPLTEMIAKKMNVSPKTVETYRVRLKDKLGIDNLNELIQRATRWVAETR